MAMYYTQIMKNINHPIKKNNNNKQTKINNNNNKRKQENKYMSWFRA